MVMLPVPRCSHCSVGSTISKDEGFFAHLALLIIVRLDRSCSPLTGNPEGQQVHKYHSHKTGGKDL